MPFLIRKINRPQIGLFFCIKNRKGFQKILVNDFDTPPTFISGTKIEIKFFQNLVLILNRFALKKCSQNFVMIKCIE